jgi:hypothetical protein
MRNMQFERVELISYVAITLRSINDRSKATEMRLKDGIRSTLMLSAHTFDSVLAILAGAFSSCNASRSNWSKILLRRPAHTVHQPLKMDPMISTRLRYLMARSETKNWRSKHWKPEYVDWCRDMLHAAMSQMDDAAVAFGHNARQSCVYEAQEMAIDSYRRNVAATRIAAAWREHNKLLSTYEVIC